MLILATAGWAVPKACASRIPGAGTHLQRYARQMRGVEINTSFYRDHSRATYERWAEQTPPGFLFSLKLPRLITHELRLRRSRRPLENFLAAAKGLGRRLGPLIVQLPPSLPFERRIAGSFFTALREQYRGQVVCEPRHVSWFNSAAEALLVKHRIARVAADPAVTPSAAQPGGWSGLAYYRWHGSPRMYWSVYDRQQIAGWAASVRSAPLRKRVWCVFDNTAGGGALPNALQLRQQLGDRY
jgi:uncharacterized protein YecE (DUF72 family)